MTSIGLEFPLDFQLQSSAVLLGIACFLSVLAAAWLARALTIRWTLVALGTLLFVLPKSSVFFFVLFGAGLLLLTTSIRGERRLTVSWWAVYYASIFFSSITSEISPAFLAPLWLLPPVASHRGEPFVFVCRIWGWVAAIAYAHQFTAPSEAMFYGWGILFSVWAILQFASLTDSSARYASLMSLLLSFSWMCLGFVSREQWWLVIGVSFFILLGLGVLERKGRLRFLLLEPLLPLPWERVDIVWRDIWKKREATPWRDTVQKVSVSVFSKIESFLERVWGWCLDALDKSVPQRAETLALWVWLGVMGLWWLIS